MSRFSLTLCLPVLVFSLACGGCTESNREVYDGPAISLSSLDQAAKAIEEEAKQLDESDRLNLPLIFDDTVWNLQPCAPAPPMKVTNLSSAFPSKVDVRGLAVAVESGRALVTYLDRSKDRHSRETYGAYCDVRGGRVLSTFELPEFAAPFSIDPSGSYAILCRADAIRYARETLYVAELSSNQVSLQQWRPLVDPAIEKPKPYVEEQEIMWASFVGTDRIVTASKAGTLHVWSFPQQQRLGSFTGIDGLPTLTPDKKHVVFAAGDTLAMLDPSAPAIIGHRRIGPSPEEPVVAVDPQGKRIAIGGKGEAMIMDLQHDACFHISAQHMSADPGSKLVSDFAFIGPFLHDTRRLYDFDSPRAVWSIGSTQWELPLGNDFWAVVWHDPNGPKFGGRELVLRSFKIPHANIQKRITHTYSTSDVLALRPGDKVKIDVRGIPMERRAEIRDALENEFAKKGFTPSGSAKVIANAFLDPEEEFEATYIKSDSVIAPVFLTDDIPQERRREVTYRGRHARLWITKDGRKLWSRSGMERPPSRLVEADVPASGELSFYGEPKYSIFIEPRLPDYISGDYSGVLGTTILRSGGITSRDSRPKSRRK